MLEQLFWVELILPTKLWERFSLHASFVRFSTLFRLENRLSYSARSEFNSAA